MRAVRLRILLVSLVISVGAFMPVGVAHADGTFAGACEFDALTWNTTPFQWLSNQGVFTFAGMANCAADVGGQSQVFPNVQLDASGVVDDPVPVWPFNAASPPPWAG